MKDKEPSFSEMAAARLWEYRKGTDEEILEELGNGWRGFAQEEQDDYIVYCSGKATYGEVKGNG